MRIFVDTVDEIYEKYYGKKVYMVSNSDQRYRMAFQKILGKQKIFKDFLETLNKNLAKRRKGSIVAGK